MKTTLVGCTDNAELREKLEPVVDALYRGGIIAFPTETVYGLGVLAHKRDAYDRLYALKGRPHSKPCAYYVRGAEDVKCIASSDMKPYVLPLLERFFPGPLTVVVPTHDGAMGVRAVDQPVMQTFLSLLTDPFIGTSANRSGDVPCSTAEAVYSEFQGEIDYIIDCGPCRHGIPSTVIDTTGPTLIVVRTGAQWEHLEAYITKQGIVYRMKKHILVVCTGNTCRSPMVEGLLKKKIQDKGLDNAYEVESCGVFAPLSVPPSRESVAILKEKGIDISGHRSRSITMDMIHKADKIVVMTKEHEMTVLAMDKSAKKKIVSLDLPDPLGRGMAFYRDLCQVAEKHLEEQSAWILQ